MPLAFAFKYPRNTIATHRFNRSHPRPPEVPGLIGAAPRGGRQGRSGSRTQGSRFLGRSRPRVGPLQGEVGVRRRPLHIQPLRNLVSQTPAAIRVADSDGTKQRTPRPLVRNVDQVSPRSLIAALRLVGAPARGGRRLARFGIHLNGRKMLKAQSDNPFDEAGRSLLAMSGVKKVNGAHPGPDGGGGGVPGDEVLGLLGDGGARQELDGSGVEHDLLVEDAVLGNALAKGAPPVQHLVQYHPQRPHVHLPAVR